MLYLVATPIGHLGDISQRALDTLRSVDTVAAEDTRKSGLLLKHFGIDKPLISFYEHNEERSGARIIELLQSGQSVALITSAGTPGISDPGFTLVRRALAADVPVTMVPGAAAFVMALVLSGLPVHSFTYRGFPPRKQAGRKKFLEVDAQSPHTLIFYESPHRVRELIEDTIVVLGNRQAALANDLTKMFEKVQRGALRDILAGLGDGELKGEYVLVIAGKDAKAGARGEEANQDDAASLDQDDAA